MPLFPRNSNRSVRSPHAHMTVTQRRQAKRSVVTGVLLVAHADEALLEQPHYGRENLRSWQPRARDVGRRTGAQFRQRCGKGRQTVVLRFVAAGPPVAMIAILLATLGVAACRLKMTAPIRADPDVSPGRGNGKRGDPFQLGGGADPPACRPDVLNPSEPIARRMPGRSSVT